MTAPSDEGEAPPATLHCTQDTARACLLAGHLIRYQDGDKYECENCSAVIPWVTHRGVLRGTRVFVEPVPKWTGHTHQLHWMGWDGSDNYYVCSVCRIQSHAHQHFDRQERAKKLAELQTP